jgi:hypothetical protein
MVASGRTERSCEKHAVPAEATVGHARKAGAHEDAHAFASYGFPSLCTTPDTQATATPSSGFPGPPSEALDDSTDAHFSPAGHPAGTRIARYPRSGQEAMMIARRCNAIAPARSRVRRSGDGVLDGLACRRLPHAIARCRGFVGRCRGGRLKSQASFRPWPSGAAGLETSCDAGAKGAARVKPRFGHDRRAQPGSRLPAPEARARQRLRAFARPTRRRDGSHEPGAPRSVCDDASPLTGR